MEKTKWEKDEGGYYSHHILVPYCGEQEAKYFVLRNPEGEGWVIASFYTFVGEYTPMEDLVFNSVQEAQDYADDVLEKIDELGLLMNA